MAAIVDCIPTALMALNMYAPGQERSERKIGGGYYEACFRTMGAQQVAAGCPAATYVSTCLYARLVPPSLEARAEGPGLVRGWTSSYQESLL